MSNEIFAIEITNFQKRYNEHLAVRDLNLKIKKGVFFGFVGPNGAGKSTTIKSMAGLINPTSGSIKIEGFDIAKEPLEVKKRIGVMLEDPVIYERLTGKEYLEFVGEMYSLKRNTIDERVKTLIKLMDLEGSILISACSLGMKRKIALAAALIHEPSVIILDEPFSGIDAPSVSRIRKMLTDMVNEGHTVFFSSHVLETVEKMSGEIGVIHKGRLLATGSMEQLRERTKCPPDSTLEDIFLKLVDTKEEELTSE